MYYLYLEFSLNAFDLICFTKCTLKNTMKNGVCLLVAGRKGERDRERKRKREKEKERGR